MRLVVLLGTAAWAWGGAAGAAAPKPASAPKAPPKPAVARPVPIGTTAHAVGGDLRLTLVARMQHYNDKPRDPADRYDDDIYSPKSARFSPDGRKVYVNSLEGDATVVYDAFTLSKTGVIHHRFGVAEAALFPAGAPYDYRFLARPDGDGPNRFTGNPVEMEFTHGGRYLWISYYRRDYDRNCAGPSAVAVVDTRTDTVVRVLPSGPIPKFLVVSPDGGRLAMIHWGDNTVGFVDIRGDDPAAFRLTNLIEVGSRMDLAPLARPGRRVNRDKVCGACLRGAAFSADGRWLLVGRLSGGGIAVIDAQEGRYVGTAQGMQPTPRHLVARGDRLWVGSNIGGYVALFSVDAVVAAARARRVATPIVERHIGYGVRTIALSPDGRWVYAAVNGRSRLAVLRADTLAPEVEIAADSFPVGLDVSPDGTRVWVTSQGRERKGGNSVCVYNVTVAPRAP